MHQSITVTATKAQKTWSECVEYYNFSRQIHDEWLTEARIEEYLAARVFKMKPYLAMRHWKAVHSPFLTQEDQVKLVNYIQFHAAIIMQEHDTCPEYAINTVIKLLGY